MDIGNGSFDYMNDPIVPYLVNAHWAVTELMIKCANRL